MLVWEPGAGGVDVDVKIAVFSGGSGQGKSGGTCVWKVWSWGRVVECSRGIGCVWSRDYKNFKAFCVEEGGIWGAERELLGLFCAEQCLWRVVW